MSGTVPTPGDDAEDVSLVPLEPLPEDGPVSPAGRRAGRRAGRLAVRWHVPQGRRLVVPVLAALVVLSLPWWVGAYGAELLVELAVVAVLAQWWSLLAGAAGVISLSGAFHAGTGAYAWLLLTRVGLSPVVAVLVAALVSAAPAIPVAWALRRLPPRWAAVGGLVLAATGSALVTVIDGSARRGRTVRAAATMGPLLRRSATIWLGALLVVATVLAASAFLRSAAGLTVRASKDDGEAAAALGLKPEVPILTLWVAGAAATGAAAALVHLGTGVVAVGEAFDPLRWVLVPVLAALLGGTRMVGGPMLGAVAVVAAERLLGTAGGLLAVSLAASWLLIGRAEGLAGLVFPWVREFLWGQDATVRKPPGSSTGSADRR